MAVYAKYHAGVILIFMKKYRHLSVSAAKWLALALFLLAQPVLAGENSVQASGQAVSDAKNQGRIVVSLSDSQWKLWFDAGAQWTNDDLFLPPVDLAKLPVNAPTCGWEGLGGQKASNVSVPGTVEEYLPPPKSGHGYFGVSWWTRNIKIPEAASGKRVMLKFGSVRERAEIYLDRKLVGYNLIGSTPFEVDITSEVAPGKEYQLAVRVTNPGGGFASGDTEQISWGKYKLPSSHGFGGIIGELILECTDPVYISDVYMQNTPDAHQVNAIISITNTTDNAVKGRLDLNVMPKDQANASVFHDAAPEMVFPPGQTFIKSIKVSVASAKLWDLEHPNLYVCNVALTGGDTQADQVEQTFGFRWFAPEDIGSNAVFRLNGKRIFIRTAISWGFWPISGLCPTPELAERQIKAAKDFGMNMLNFHRCIGQPVVLDKADEMGLLYFEEPGGYVTGGNDPFAQAIAREKLLRMVKRDRSHPSLVIYNMINEQWDRFGADKDDALFQKHKSDLRSAHEQDPSRVITYASAWAGKPDEDAKTKLHMRPFDTNQYLNGWYDRHRAGGPITWQESLYQNPANHYGYLNNPHEIVYWGEEGAISTPPPLGTIKTILDGSPHNGFDGDTWLKWHDRVEAFLKEKKLLQQYPDVDAFCKALGAISLEHQGRKFELTRICDFNDGYCINGWEDTLEDNHSAVVDPWRNPKADPEIMARYNKPLHVAVQSRNLITELGKEFKVDFFVLNEVNLHGSHTLRIRLKDKRGYELFQKEVPVDLKGGDTYGQLVAQTVAIPATKVGSLSIEAELVDSSGLKRADGCEEVLVVDWRSAQLSGKGAVYEWGNGVRDFLKTQKSLDVPVFDGSQGKLDWLVLARPSFPAPQVIAPEAYCDADGKPAGVKTSFYKGLEMNVKPAVVRTQKSISFKNSAGAAPDPDLGTDRRYAIRWEGWINPPVSGKYGFTLKASASPWVFKPIQFYINDAKVLEIKASQFQGEPCTEVELQAGKPIKVRVDYFNWSSAGSLQLMWSPPEANRLEPQQIIQRAKQDGTTILLVDYAENWMPLLATNKLVKCDGSLAVGKNWEGGQYFVRTNAVLFKDLPTGVMSWPYEGVLQEGRSRYGLKLLGEELVAGCWQSSPFDLATSVAIVPCGTGKIVISTLDIGSNLSKNGGPAAVARKLLCNYIQFAATKN